MRTCSSISILTLGAQVHQAARLSLTLPAAAALLCPDSPCPAWWRRDRTGVQLKDKWRNLVKFKHVSRSEVDAFRGASTLDRSASSLAPSCGVAVL